MKKNKLLYSFGLTRGCDHYIDDVEHFMDVKDLEESDTQPSLGSIVLAGTFAECGGGDYSQSHISIYDLHKRFNELLAKHNKNDAINILLEEYHCKPLDTRNKYPNRYYVEK